MTLYCRLALFAMTALQIVPTCNAQDEKRDFFVFLTTGKPTQGIAAEEIQKKQAAHLENFGRLAKLGSLTTAGPCADPDKVTRGIVVIHADSIPDAEAMFGPDPYVSEGFMKAELNGFQTVAGKLQLVSEVTSMEQSVIVIISQGNKWPSHPSLVKTIGPKLTALAKEQFDAKKLAFAGLFNTKSNNASKRVAVMIFYGKDLDSVKSILESHELLREEWVRFQAFPQYLAKGALVD